MANIRFCTVHSIPHEILAQIFLVGSDAEHTGGQEGSRPSRSREEFQTTVSHVCQQWRSVAIMTASLWTSLTFDEGPPFQKSLTWIERSKDCPLSIRIQESNRWSIWNQDAEKLIVDCRWIYEFLHPYPVNQHTFLIQCMRFTNILEIIIPHINRWRRLYIALDEYGLMLLSLKRLGSCMEAANLESFEFKTKGVSGNTCPFPMVPDGISFSLRMPSLRVLLLRGSQVRWPGLADSPHLESLSISLHPMNLHGDEAVPQIIKAVAGRRLAYLNLEMPCLVHPRAESSGRSHSSTGDENISLLNPVDVTTIRLAMMPDFYASLFWRQVRTPSSLEHLILNLPSDLYDRFVRTICGLQPKKSTDPGAALPMGHPHNILSGLVHLTITALRTTRSRVIPEFLSRLPSARSIKINFDTVDECFYCYFVTTYRCTASGLALADLHEDCGANQAFSPPAYTKPEYTQVFMPLLEKLAVVGLSGQDLLRLVQARQSFGVPLKELYVDDDIELDADESSWLSENMEVFEFSDGLRRDDDFVPDWAAQG